MLKICTNCQYIGKGKSQEECSWGTTVLFVIAALVTIIISLYFPLALIITFILIALVLTGAEQCIADCSLCPKCDKYFMIAVDADEAKGFISDNKIDISNLKESQASLLDKINKFSYEKPKLCTECLYIGPSYYSKHVHGITKGLLWISAGIITLLLGYIYPLSVFGSFFLFLGGSVFLAASYKDEKKCLKCHKKTMVHLDSNAAKIIAEQKQLKLPIIIKPAHPFLNDYLVSTIWVIVITIIAIIYYYLYQYFVRIHG